MDNGCFIFIKQILMIMLDFCHPCVKKGKYFSSCCIGDIRKRCTDELKGEVDYVSMKICHDDCELSDDTPIELVLADVKVLKCVISGWAKPSAAQVYAKRTKSNFFELLF